MKMVKNVMNQCTPSRSRHKKSMSENIQGIVLVNWPVGQLRQIWDGGINSVNFVDSFNFINIDNIVDTVNYVDNYNIINNHNIINDPNIVNAINFINSQ